MPNRPDTLYKLGIEINITNTKKAYSTKKKKKSWKIRWDFLVLIQFSAYAIPASTVYSFGDMLLKKYRFGYHIFKYLENMG